MTMPQAFIFCLVSVAFQTGGKCSKGSVSTENLNLEFSWEAANRGKDIIFPWRSMEFYLITVNGESARHTKICKCIFYNRNSNSEIVFQYLYCQRDKHVVNIKLLRKLNFLELCRPKLPWLRPCSTVINHTDVRHYGFVGLLLSRINTRADQTVCEQLLTRIKSHMNFHKLSLR